MSMTVFHGCRDEDSMSGLDKNSKSDFSWLGQCFLLHVMRTAKVAFHAEDSFMAAVIRTVRVTVRVFSGYRDEDSY